MTAQAETKESQEKGGLEISIAPVNYQKMLGSKTTRVPVAAEPFGADLNMPQGASPYEETTEPQLEPKPNRLAYLLKINNKLNRVFRGAGTVVQFNDGTKLVAVDQAGYQQFTGAIVPPRSEKQVIVYGPPLDQVADKTTVGLFLYDVVTAVNEAGTVIEKQNYEWYFDFSVKIEEVASQIKKQRVWLYPGQIQSEEMMKQQQEMINRARNGIPGSQ